MNVLSRRERIMVQVKRRMKEIQEGQPAVDPYQITFGIVTRGGSLEGIHRASGQYALAIIDTDEAKTAKMQQSVNTLTVGLEFVAWVDGEDPSTAGNRVLAAIQRKMREDINLTEPDDTVRAQLDRQLSEQVEEVRNQLFIDGFADKKISGAIFYNITYKHGVNDPRVLVSSSA